MGQLYTSPSPWQYKKKVLSLSAGRKKFNSCQNLQNALQSIHNLKGHTMNRHDKIELILEHIIQRGQYSGLYMEKITSMTDDELDRELDRLEQLAIYGG
jgi:hypothetical protein